MNQRLRKLPDGSGREGSDQVCWFNTRIDYGYKQGVERELGEIWWPFALHFLVSPTEGWGLTHLPSGRRVPWCSTLAKARRAAQQLRALPVDWSFTKPSGAKWEACHAVVTPWLRKRKALAPATKASAVDPVGETVTG